MFSEDEIYDFLSDRDLRLKRIEKADSDVFLLKMNLLNVK